MPVRRGRTDRACDPSTAGADGAAVRAGINVAAIAKVALNGHEYVAVAAQAKRADFIKDGNCFIPDHPTDRHDG